MNINSTASYSNALYQWQREHLKNTGSGSSQQTSTINALFNQTSMSTQITSMVELTKYAMNAMGIGSNGRVTFSQITKYCQQLQNQFNKGVKDGFAASGISNIQDLSFSISAGGKLTVDGSNEQDRKKAQAWFDSNPDISKKIYESIKEANIEFTDDIKLSISSTGKITALNSKETSMQAFLDSSLPLANDLLAHLTDLNLNIPSSMEFNFDEDGNLIIKNEDTNTREINNFLSKNNEFADTIKKELKKNNIELSAVTLKINADGKTQIHINDNNLSDIQNILNDKSDLGKRIYASLDSIGIDPAVNFSIQLNQDGSVNIVSDHPDRDKVQQFFENNPELVKIYRQIETLAGVEDARKAMQLSPNEMRKRIQIESMVAWWAGSGNSNSYFGIYNNGSTSLFSGLNIQV